MAIGRRTSTAAGILVALVGPLQGNALAYAPPWGNSATLGGGISLVSTDTTRWALVASAEPILIRTRDAWIAGALRIDPLTSAIGVTNLVAMSRRLAIGGEFLVRADSYKLTSDVLPEGTIRHPFRPNSAVMAIGPELRGAYLENLSFFSLWASPRLSFLTNGLRLGLNGGPQTTIGPLSFGYAFDVAWNLSPPGDVPMSRLETRHEAGFRLLLGRGVFFQADFVYVPFDAYLDVQAIATSGLGVYW